MDLNIIIFTMLFNVTLAWENLVSAYSGIAGIHDIEGNPAAKPKMG